jgi:hypothetical protein
VEPIIAPSKSADIGMRQLRSLANMQPKQRWEVIAQGLPLLLKSAEGLDASSRGVKDSARSRDILEGHASEEGAKILILLDYVRCPLGLSEFAQRTLSKFYDHGTRLIYADACHWRPTDLNELREYVDRERRSHYLEGFAGEYILPNSNIYQRESRLYADLTRQQDGSFIWNDPESSIGYDSPWILSPAAIRVARSLAKFGAFNAQGLAIIHRIWAAQSFTGPEHAMRCDELIRETLKALIEANLVSADAEERDARVIYGSWQMPMYAIDTKSTEASLEDLHAAQERELYAQM